MAKAETHYRTCFMITKVSSVCIAKIFEINGYDKPEKALSTVQHLLETCYNNNMVSFW